MGQESRASEDGLCDSPLRGSDGWGSIWTKDEAALYFAVTMAGEDPVPTSRRAAPRAEPLTSITSEDMPMTEFAPGLHAAIGKEVDVSAYDRFTGRWSRLFVPDVIAAAEISSGCTVLDICTGTGEVAVAALPLIGATGILVGADISPEMVRSARKRVDNPQFLSIVTDGQALAFRDDCFDAVVC